jgi:hypothetical protein
LGVVISKKHDSFNQNVVKLSLVMREFTVVRPACGFASNSTDGAQILDFQDICGIENRTDFETKFSDLYLHFRFGT